jgi:hypothetical protein
MKNVTGRVSLQRSTQTGLVRRQSNWRTDGIGWSTVCLPSVTPRHATLTSPVPTVIIPEDRVPALNRSIEQGFVKGGPPGQEGYIAGIEGESSPSAAMICGTFPDMFPVFHHLHCLNVLRQALWVHEYPKGLVPSLFKYNSPTVARKHADHCISTLHQALTCNADLTPYLLYDSTGKGAGVAREDFQATHKCKRFEPLIDWVHTNGFVVSAEDLRAGKDHGA